MLSVFPEILFLSPFAATLLRITVAIVFLYAAIMQARRIEILSEVPVPVLGKGAWIVWASVLFDTTIGVLLLVGLYTQVAALVGAIAIIKSIVFVPSYLAQIPVSRGAAALTAVILLSLLLTGAGAFAFDWPL